MSFRTFSVWDGTCPDHRSNWMADYIRGEEKGYLHLLASKDESLLRRRNAFLLFYLFLDPGDVVIWFNV